MAAAGVTAATLPATADAGLRAGGNGTLLATSLDGANEVPVEGGPAVGDMDGAALEFVQVEGDQVSVAVKWCDTGRPTMLHIHEGVRGVNGGIKVDFSPLLKKAKHHTLVGTVTVEDGALLDRLTSDPGAFYANLHTAEFPGGAVRGQLHQVTTQIDFRHALRNSWVAPDRGVVTGEPHGADYVSVRR
ncbi:CHRD domain-containing protein [Streptomyces kunmingensis]|uniref:CHRD domain-containing protein n=1 Tax=Streptomyces kunmingensis TaxID=68225 RepID=A0ABU6CQX6_9ACTN|nr:CHRD domain-containing protein [Streptomyces kunmingensis]MEB3966765.1 CHRD domain-containing protein [Streptomyces kunmingensis]